MTRYRTIVTTHSRELPKGQPFNLEHDENEAVKILDVRDVGAETHLTYLRIKRVQTDD